MSEKKVKCRKDYICSQCEEVIKKGGYALHYRGRGAKYNSDDEQIGIEFFEYRLHADSFICNRNNGALLFDLSYTEEDYW